MVASGAGFPARAGVRGGSGVPPPRPVGPLPRPLVRQPRDDATMIGREVERETVRGLVDAARRGHGRLLLITGEPGIGKTTLLTDLTAYAAERGLHVLSGRAVQGGGTY